MKGFTKIPNWLLDSYNGLTNAEFRVLMCIYRLTAGFHRKSYKIEYSLITEMTGVKNVSIICNSLKQMGWIDFNAELGKANVINILKPINSVNDTHPVSEPHPLTHLTTSRGAKENFKENLNKELFVEFKKKYPEDKFDDDTVFNAWQSLTDTDKQLAVGVMEYQNNKWNNPNFDRKYIPKASNYLLKRKFLDDAVRQHYEDEIKRNREAKKQRQYFIDAEENSASDEEKQAILKDALKN